MKKTTLALVACMSLIGHAAGVDFKTIPDWLKLPEGRATLGNQHGDVAVSAKGEVYVSVQDPRLACRSSAPDGNFLRNVPDRAQRFPRLRHPQDSPTASSFSASASASRPSSR